MNTPWIPHLWPPPQTNCDVSFANFPPSGDLPDPTGKGVALDSAWRLRELACVGGTGDPGRLIAETRKEYCYASWDLLGTEWFCSVKFYL
jgi:hypothetical protein